MRNKCLLGLGLVTVISLTSVIAFAFSFTDGPTAENEREPVEQVVVLDQTDETFMTTSFETTEISTELENDCNTEFSFDDAYILAKIAMAEAESEDTEGKALVMLVVLNRVKDDKFPDSIEAVVMQKGQFSPVANGRYDEVEPDEDCFKALELIQKCGWDESNGATYFESKSDSTWHSENLTFLFKHGKHYFYKE